MGNSEVMAMGTLSVIHQMSIQATTPSTLAWATSNEPGCNHQISAKAMGPSTSERYLLVEFMVVKCNVDRELSGKFAPCKKGQ